MALLTTVSCPEWPDKTIGRSSPGPPANWCDCLTLSWLAQAPIKGAIPMIAARRILLLQTPLLCFAIFTGRTINDLLGQEISGGLQMPKLLPNRGLPRSRRCPNQAVNPLSPSALPSNHPPVVIGVAHRNAPRSLEGIFI